MTTTLAAAIASFAWAMAESSSSGSRACRAVAGLVVVTPAAGFVTSTGAVVIGVLDLPRVARSTG